MRKDRQPAALPVAGLAVAALLVATAALAGAGSAHAATPAAGLGGSAMNVRVLSAGGASGDVQIVADLAAVLDDAERLRIVPVVGNGGTRNIADLLSEPVVADVAIVQADALNAMKSDKPVRGERELLYVAKLFNEEVHVVARADIETLAALAGKKVAVGLPGSGSHQTATALFAALAIPIEPVELEPAAALEELRSGRIAAMLTVSGKPSGAAPAVAGTDADGGQLHLLSVPVNEALLVDYVPSTLTHDDDPELIAPGASVETISVPAVMVVAAAEPGGARERRIAAFVGSFFDNFARFQEPPRHPKWREVNLAASVTGWRRLPVALDWVRVNMATAEEKKLHAAFNDMLRFLADESVRPGSKALGERERDALFWRFVDWRAGQATPSP